MSRHLRQSWRKQSCIKSPHLPRPTLQRCSGAIAEGLSRGEESVRHVEAGCAAGAQSRWDHSTDGRLQSLQSGPQHERRLTLIAQHAAMNQSHDANDLYDAPSAATFSISLPAVDCQHAVRGGQVRASSRKLRSLHCCERRLRLSRPGFGINAGSPQTSVSAAASPEPQLPGRAPSQ